LSDLDHLRGLTELRVLWLTDNPITEKPGYREYTIARLPQLTKLDEVDITADDREAANRKFPAQPPAAAPPPVPPSAREGQANILAAIRLLLQNLEADALNVLYAEIEQLRRK
jgi:protein TilB